MKTMIGLTAMVGSVVLGASGVVHAATLCAKSGTASAAVSVPVQGVGGTSCRTGETAFLTEPPAVTARQGAYKNNAYGSFTSLFTPVFVTVKEPGMYVVVASGVVHYAESGTTQNAVIQCKLKKRLSSGALSDSLSTTLTVQNIKKFAYDPMATTATGYLYAGEGAELTCQQYSESYPWYSLDVSFRELKVTAVKVSSVSETVIPEKPYQIP